MQEVVILSDLWGKRKSEWLALYQQFLSPEYEVKFYDSCELGQIDLSKYEEINLHQQFVEFGIEQAASQLVQLETKPKLYIGCSVGGTILWKAGLMGLPIKRLITISSTRLRKEKESPDCPTKLYFGASDPYRPDSDFYKSLGLAPPVLLEGGHEIYTLKSCIEIILKDSLVG
ncbi:MAG: alpha/beta hydrolase [Bacteroidia bacterium]|nr:alpha/beta hydrolase [Bacteroidia bacterium]